MSIYSGKNIKVEIFGSSHSDKIGGKIFGISKEKTDKDRLSAFLKRRKGGGCDYSTSRAEEDKVVFLETENEKEISFYIENKDVRKTDYEKLYGIPRPSHADLAWHLKDGSLDFSGGGRFSGRLTAPLCVVGGILKQRLEEKGVYILSYVAQTGPVKGVSYKDREITKEFIEKNIQGYPSLSEKEKMMEYLDKARKKGDSVGGKIECVVFGLKAGLGDSSFDGLEGKISSLLYSIPAVKGVEFGLGFDFVTKHGSEVNDQMEYDNGKVKFLSNNSGGINGGISNGEKITIGVAIKPTPSISIKQKTINLIKKENTTIEIEGRHDVCICPRALPAIESAVAVALYDELV